MNMTEKQKKSIAKEAVKIADFHMKNLGIERNKKNHELAIQMFIEGVMFLSINKVAKEIK